MFGTLARGLTLLARIVGRTGPARARTRRHVCPRFCLGGRGKPASFADGSASGSGDRPGLQNRWHVLRGMFGGFDSHALPPVIGGIHYGIPQTLMVRRASLPLLSPAL